MKRRHFIEIADEAWCPQPIKDAVTDYCRVLLAAIKPYKAIAPLLAEAIRKTGSRQVLDLASGASGPWLWMQPLLREMGADVSVRLSDHYPNQQALEWARLKSQQTISYHPDPVDAARVPGELAGFRTIFTAFHHLRPDQARSALADAVARREGIGVFECAMRSPWMIPFAAIPTPFRVLLVTPFIRPFRWSRLLWTYLIPVVPFVLTFDTVVSCLRVYTVEELRDLTSGLGGYRWDAGIVWSKRPPIPITYLIGVPDES